MRKMAETDRTTKGLWALVRCASELARKRLSEFLRPTAGEKAQQVIREHDRLHLRQLLAAMGPGNLGEDEATKLGAATKDALRTKDEGGP
jgi:hypothetical protein